MPHDQEMSLGTEISNLVRPIIHKILASGRLNTIAATQGEIEAEFRYQGIQLDEYETLVSYLKRLHSQELLGYERIDCMDVISPSFICDQQCDRREFRTRATLVNKKAITNIVCDRNWLRDDDCFLSLASVKKIETLVYSVDLNVAAAQHALRFGSKLETPLLPTRPQYNRWIDDLLMRITSIERIQTKTVTHRLEACFRLKERHAFTVPGVCRIHVTKCRTSAIPSNLRTSVASYDLEIEVSDIYSESSVTGAIHWLIECLKCIHDAPDLPCSSLYNELIGRYRRTKDIILHKISANDTVTDPGAIVSPKLAALFEPCITHLHDYSLSLKVDGVNTNYMITVMHSRTVYFCRILSYGGKTLRLDVMLSLSMDPQALHYLFCDSGHMQKQCRQHPRILLINGESCTTDGARQLFIPFDVYYTYEGNGRELDLLYTEPCHSRRLKYLTDWMLRIPMEYESTIRNLFLLKQFIELGGGVATLSACIAKLRQEDEQDVFEKHGIKTDGFILTPISQSPDFASPVAWMNNYKIKLPSEITIDVQVKNIIPDSASHFRADILPIITSEQGLGADITSITLSAQDRKQWAITEASILECKFVRDIETSGFRLQITRARQDKCKPNRDLTVSQIYDYVINYGNCTDLADLAIFRPPESNSKAGERRRVTGGVYHFTPIPTSASLSSASAVSELLPEAAHSMRRQALVRGGSVRSAITAYLDKYRIEKIRWLDICITERQTQATKEARLELEREYGIEIDLTCAVLELGTISPSLFISSAIAKPSDGYSIITAVNTLHFFEHASTFLSNVVVDNSLLNCTENDGSIAIVYDIDQTCLDRLYRSKALDRLNTLHVQPNTSFRRCSRDSWLLYDIASGNPHYMLCRPPCMETMTNLLRSNFTTFGQQGYSFQLSDVDDVYRQLVLLRCGRK